MKRNHRIVISVAALATMSIAGCVDNEAVGTFGSSTSVRQQAVTVVPEFIITGADAIPESLFVTQLGLTVSEIRLEPMWSKDSLAYSTREAVAINFDIAAGQTTQAQEALELPAAGRYLVSIRLEPTAAEDGQEPASFSLDGFVAGQRTQPIVDDTSDGRPQPMPFDKTEDNAELTDRHAYPTQWTPFEYNSKRAVFYTFNDVELEAGTQSLTFSFDVRDWAADVMVPISNAVRSSGGWDDSVDVTNQIDSTGNGVEALIRTGVVRSDRNPG